MPNAVVWRQREGIVVTHKQKKLWDELMRLTSGVITRKIPVASVSNYNRRVWSTLQKRKHIYVTSDGLLVNITYEGKEFFARVEPVVHRRDGICPKCGKRPLHTYSTGLKADYCEVCLHSRKRYHLREPRLCSCGRGMTKVTANGFIYRKCEQCQYEANQAWAVKRQAILQARVASGDIPRCPKCGEPVHISKSDMVYTYCTKHLNEIDRNRRKHQKIRRFEEMLKDKS